MTRSFADIARSGGIAGWRIVLLAAVVVVLLLAAQVALTRQRIVTIDAGLSPRMTAEQAIGLATSQVSNMAQSVGHSTASTIVFAHAVRGGAIASVEVDAPVFEGSAADGTYWIVRAEGTFVGRRGRGPDQIFDTGYLIIDDANGDIVGMGMP